MPELNRTVRVQDFPSFSIFRLIALSLILLATIFLRQEVMGIDVVIKVYFVSCISFLISGITIVFWEQTQKIRLFVYYQIFYDILLTSYLIFHTGINESIFLFLYILNIIHAAITYQVIGALAVAFAAGITYGLIYYVNKDTSQDNQLYTLFYNELFFLLTALLSGQLMEELKRQTKLLNTEREEVDRLRLLTDRLINHLPSGIIQVDRDNRVVSLNQIAIDLFNLKSVPKEKVYYFDLVPELRDMRAKWFSLSESERLKFGFPMKREGVDRFLSLQVVLMPDSAQGAAESAPPIEGRTGLIFVIQDISELRRLEEKIQLDSKLAAVGQLAAGIAHEIRTPLASISGSIETLLKNIRPANSDDEKLVSISQREIRRLDRLITEFLIFVKPITNEFKHLSLNRIVEEVVLGIRNIKDAPVEANFNIDLGSTLELMGDAEKLKQVFFNLFTNSIEAAKGKAVEIKVSSVRGDHEVTITVEDNGQGIPKENSSKIFDPFFTTKKSGTGLGLPNVAQIVKSHKGDIRCVSSPLGAKFEIVLPLDQSVRATGKIGA